jgi:hypothetical protein
MSFLVGSGTTLHVQELFAEQVDEISLDTSSGTLSPVIIKSWDITRDGSYLDQELRYSHLVYYGELVLDNALGEIAVGWLYSTDNGVTWLEWFRDSTSTAVYDAISDQDADPVNGFPDSATNIAFGIWNRFDAADGRAKHLIGQVILTLPPGVTVSES